MANEIQPFNYGEIEPATAEKLKRHATAIRGIQSKAIYEIGEELQSAHDELADHNGGTFYAWCESIGIGRDTVQRILRYHEFVAANCGNRELLESLPKSLIYEASKKSTPQELKDKVASGDVTTLPEFKKLKAELEATKNVLRTTESKLGEKDAEIEAAKKERDDANAEARHHDAMRSAAISEKVLAEQELHDAKAEADQLREKASAYDDLQQMNHTLREKLREKDEELLNRPERETVVTKEVVPEDYNDIKEGNAILRKQVAELRAHAQGMSLQEYAQKDEKHSEFVKTLDEEYASAKRIRGILSTLVQIQMHEAEIKEDARCFLKVSSDREETLADAQDTVRKAKRGIEVLEEVFFTSSPLKVVK